MVDIALTITGTDLPTIKGIYRKCCLKKAANTIKDICHPDHVLNLLLPLGQGFQNSNTMTSKYNEPMTHLHDLFYTSTTYSMSEYFNGHPDKPQSEP